ncbi:BadF/BadG/BcrA/BcrD ATPase family protein [Gryllotalpicola daejeonensis]|uniref:BadF/BadG/BcrA/BcrD ATPase family protein n=1 Tax=Gryllotalpicola daejeonensis TaxID=993087 RepID=A0ABP7ZP39_9MICO
MLRLFLAVDAGGTSTRCVAVDEYGGCHGYGRSASGNPISAGPALAARSVAEAAGQALRQANAAGGESGPRVASVLLAMAGASALSGTELFAAELAPLGVSAPVAFAPDLLATFCSGTWRLDGYALVAGTGATAVRVEGGEVACTADGLGWLLGDEGSGFWIGERVARAAVTDLDRRGPQTALTELLLAELGLTADDTLYQGRPAVLQHLVETLYALRPVQLAQFARLAFDAARAGDAVAARIVRDAADALAHTLATVDDAQVDGPVVLGGGTVAQHDELVARIGDARTSGGLPREVRVVADGVVGAAVIALRQASVAVDEQVFARIVDTLATLR